LEQDVSVIAFILLAPQDSGGQVAEIARTFGVDWTHLVAQIISFGIVCAVLYRFAYRRVLVMLDERRKQIAQGLANAAKIKEELDRIEAQRQEVMSQAYAQAAKVIEEARAAAAQLREQEIRKATAAAEQIINKAHEAAAQDHDRMIAELKRQLARLVVQAASTVTGKILTADDQRRLAEETVKEVAA
jgi:F-type H+-transporting ATPase subunit b